MTTATDFSKMVPGFDFLQGLLKNGGVGLPTMGQWIAPTLDPDKIDQEIQKLRTVQFWLEQNAKLLATTIQALEVQRMTLSTLRTMNLPLAELRDALKAPVTPVPGKAAAAPLPRRAGIDAGGASPASPPAAPVVDPMQWWGALAKQFTELATQALKEGNGSAASRPAGVSGGARAAAAPDQAPAAAPAKPSGASGVAGKAPRAARRRG